jgi:GPH family glycoside/pentoside/hexuronide:cation symporter
MIAAWRTRRPPGESPALSVSESLYSRVRTRVGKVPITTKIFQAVGALPEGLKNFGFSTFLLLYYNQILGLGAFKASVAIATALIIDAAMDPLIGSFSDSLKTRLGRRHLLMYVSAIPIGIGLFLVFSPPAGLSEALLLLWLFATVVFTHVSMSLFVVPWTALYAEFSEDYAERTVIVTWRYAIGLTGMLVFTIVTWKLIFHGTPAFKVGQLNPNAYGHFAPVVALCATAAVLVTTHLTRREIPFLLQPVSATPRFSFLRVWRDVASTFSNRDFLVLFLGALTTAAITGTLDALGIYMSTFFWGLTSEKLVWFSLTAVGALLAFLTLSLVERIFDKKALLLATFALLVIDGMGVTGLRLMNILPANGSSTLLVILVCNDTVRAYLGTVLGIMFASMLADTLDVQELATGKRQEGVFAAALSFSGKATAGVGAMVAGFMLQYVIRWPAHANPATIDPHIVIRMGLTAGVLVPALLIVPLMLGAQYRITRAKHMITRQELDRRRAASPAAQPDIDIDGLDLEMAIAPPSHPSHP